MTAVRTRRIIAGVISAILLAVTAAATQIADDQILGPWWPWLWGLTTAAMLVACVRADSSMTWWPAGIMLTAVALTRIPVVLDNGGVRYSPPIARFGVFVYLLLAWLVVCVWSLAAPRRP